MLEKQIEAFKAYKQRSWKSPSTRRNNNYYFKKLLEFLGGEKMTRGLIINFFNTLEEEGMAESSRRQAETAILAFTAWLHREEFTTKDMGKGIERTRVHRKPRILPTQQEVLGYIKEVTEPGPGDNRLTTFSKMEHRACLSFIVVACGGRNFETTHILREDVSISGRQLEIAHGKRGSRMAVIPEVPWLIGELERRVKGMRTPSEIKTLQDRSHYKESDIERLFVVNEARLQKHMREVGKLFGRSMTVHDLRRIWARDMKMNGAHIDDIKEAMGHKKIETTMRYLEYDTSSIKKTIDNFSSEVRKYRTREDLVKEMVSELNDKYGSIQLLEDKDGVVYLGVKPYVYTSP